MKRLFKFLAIVIASVLVAGVLPAAAVSAAESPTLRAPSKAIFVGGCKGTKASGKKASYKSYLKVTSLLTGFDKDTMKIKLTSSDKTIATTSNSTYKVKAKAPGTATITVKVYKGKATSKNLILNSSFKVTVKKNASDSDLTFKGITAGGTYTEGQTITVSLPKGTDTDKRRLSAVSSNVTVKSAGTNKWKVTFNKAGAFELLAETYMSSSYKGATASKTIKGTVEPADKPLSIGVEQKSLKSFVITGLQEEIEKEDIAFYTLSGKDIKSDKKAYLNEVKYDAKTGEATVTTYNELVGGTVYYVEIDGSVANFTAANAELSDVKKLELTTTEAKVNESTALVFKYYDSKGIDITDKVKSLVNPSNLAVEISPSVDYAYIIGNDITINEADKTVGIKATLTAGVDTKTNEVIYVYGTGAVKSYKDHLDNTQNLYAIVEDDGVYMTTKEGQSTLSVKYGDPATFEALFYFSDKTYKTFNDTGYAISSANPAVLMIGSKSSTGGWVLNPTNVGSTVLFISEGPTFNADKVVATVNVSVQAARKATRFEVTQSKTELNTNSAVNDFLYFTATAYDQYGDEITGATFSIEQDANSKVATGTFPSLAFYGSACYVDGTTFVSSGNAGTHLTVNITCDNIENCPARPYTIYVADVAPSEPDKLWVAGNTRMIVDGETVIDTMLKHGTQPNKGAAVAAHFYSTVNGKAYFVSEEIGTLLKVDPSKNASSLSASALGVPKDVPKLYFTISLNGKVIDPTESTYSSLINIGSSSVEFLPFKTGGKLPKGDYTVSVYKLIPKDSGSGVIPLGTKTIKVIESTPDTSFTKVAANVSGTLPGVLGTSFKVYYEGADVTSSITGGDWTGPDTNSGAVFVRTIKVGGLYSSAYGSFSVDIPVGELIYVK